MLSDWCIIYHGVFVVVYTSHWLWPQAMKYARLLWLHSKYHRWCKRNEPYTDPNLFLHRPCTFLRGVVTTLLLLCCEQCIPRANLSGQTCRRENMLEILLAKKNFWPIFGREEIPVRWKLFSSRKFPGHSVDSERFPDPNREIISTGTAITQFSREQSYIKWYAEKMALYRVMVSALFFKTRAARRRV